jgi:hypothetical protein
VIAVRALDEDGTMTPWSLLGVGAESAWLSGLDARTALACWIERRDEATRMRVVRLRRTTG